MNHEEKKSELVFRVSKCLSTVFDDHKKSFSRPNYTFSLHPERGHCRLRLVQAMNRRGDIRIITLQDPRERMMEDTGPPPQVMKQ